MLLFALSSFSQSGIAFSSSSSVVCVDMESDIKDVPIEQLSPTTCFKVCENKNVTYSLVGNLGSNYTISWQVSGGVITGNNTSATVNVNWGSAGLGNISFIYTSPTTTITKTICYQRIIKPVALFDVLPASPDGVIYTCENEIINFTNFSHANNGAGLYNYLWDFGDGTTSTAMNPSHSYNSQGNYEVLLSVTNSCGCSHKFLKKVKVGPIRKLAIVCPGVVCDSQKVNYKLDPAPECASNTGWSIIGGTIVESGIDNVDVVWDKVDDTGFGYLTYSPNSSCFACYVPTTIRVPVIKNTIKIQGPASLCIGGQGRFSIPKWPSTDVQWEIVGNNPSNPLAILYLQDQRNEIVIEALAAGTYTLRALYQNTFINCGGIGTIEFDVINGNTFTGPELVCSNQSATYTSDTGLLNWTLLNGSNQVIASSNNQQTFNYQFTTTGTYTLQTAATPSCEGSSKTITVVASPIPQAITGSLTVCNGVNYTYSIGTPEANMQYTWAVTGGTISGSNVGNQVNVTFTGGVSYLQVIKSSSNPIVCAAAPVQITINKTTLNAAISAANASVCANSTASYQAINTGSSPETEYAIGDTYIWSIIPATAGSITTGQNTPNIIVQWTNYNGNATVRLVIGKCNSTTTINKTIQVRGIPTITINSANSIVCAGTNIGFSLAPATLTSGTVAWKVNGVVSTQTGLTFNHTFTNFTNSNLSFVVTAQVTNPNGCIGTTNIAEYTITVKPQPTATLSYASGGFNTFCYQSEINTVFVTATSTGAAIQWYFTNLNGVTTTINPPVPTATQFGAYYFIATKNGCTTISNVLRVINNCNFIPLPCEPNPSPIITNTSNILCPAPATASTPPCIDCKQIDLIGTTSIPPINAKFAVYGPDFSNNSINATSVGNTHTKTIFVSKPGVFQTFILADYICNNETITKTERKDITIPYLSDFDFKVTCNKLEVLNRSTFITTGITNTTYRYEYKLSSATNWTQAITTPNGTIHNSLANGNYQVRLTIQARYNNILYPACQIIKNVTISTIPALSINIVNSIRCHDTAVEFGLSTQLPNVSYLWTFETVNGVPVTSTLPTPSRVFTSPGLKTVTCVITNANGCSRPISRTLTIPPSCYNGTLTTTPTPATACVGNSILLRYQPNNDVCTTGTTYTWMNENTPIATTTVPQFNVTTTGIYWVRLTSTNGCVYNTNGVVPVFRPLPSLQLISPGTLCAGSAANVGVATNGAITAWSINNILQPLPSPHATQLVLPTTLLPGTYIVSVTVALNGCSITNATTVYIEAAPQAPVVTVQVFCKDQNPAIPYFHYKLTATSSVNGPFTWSNGDFGSSIIFPQGGLISVTVANGNCTATTTLNLPKDPEKFLWSYPEGCVTLCERNWLEQLPYILGPLASFQSWNHELPLSSDSGSGMPTPIEIENGAFGTYKFALTNSNCTAIAEPLAITQYKCAECEETKFEVIDIQLGQTDYCSYAITLGITSPNYNFVLTSSNNMVIITPTTIANSGSNTHTITLIPLAGYTGEPVEIVATATNSDGLQCRLVFIVELPACNNQESSRVALNAEKKELILYPNPATTQVSVSGLLPNSKVAVYDLLGKKQNIAIIENNNIQVLNTQVLAQGIYIVLIEEPNGNKSQYKLIIN